MSLGGAGFLPHGAIESKADHSFWVEFVLVPIQEIPTQAQTSKKMGLGLLYILI